MTFFSPYQAEQDLADALDRTDEVLGTIESRSTNWFSVGLAVVRIAGGLVAKAGGAIACATGAGCAVGGAAIVSGTRNIIGGIRDLVRGIEEQ